MDSRAVSPRQSANRCLRIQLAACAASCLHVSMMMMNTSSTGNPERCSRLAFINKASESNADHLSHTRKTTTERGFRLGERATAPLAL